MKIYGIDKHTNFNIHENIVLCATKELAEREVLRLQKEDEDYWTETETLIRKETRDPLYVCPRRGEFKYKIREVEVKEVKKENTNMAYNFESKNDERYFNTYLANYKSLGSAVETAGGAWDMLAPKFEEFLDLLARNSVCIQAKYNRENGPVIWKNENE